MNINWELVLKIFVPLLSATLGGIVKGFIEKKPKLISYISHVSAFNVRNVNPSNSSFQVGTHVIVVRNAGRKVANNVSIAHKILPDYRIFPPIAYEEREMAGGAKEIFIPRLVPGEEITISYLYQYPLTAGDIIGTVKCDEGFAKVLNVMLTSQWPKWMIRLVWCFVFIGLIASTYIFIEVAQVAIDFFNELRH